MAQDEMREQAGVRCGRLHRSPRQPSGARRIARRLLRTGRLCLRRKSWNRFRHQATDGDARSSGWLEIDRSPFTKAVGLPRLRAHWVLPQIVVQVAFIEWTAHGKLRHSRLLGVLDNKKPEEIVRGAS